MLPHEKKGYNRFRGTTQPVPLFLRSTSVPFNQPALQTMTNINEEIKFGMDSKDDEKVAVSNQQQVLSSMFTNAASATGQLSLTFVGAYDFQTRNTE